MLNDHRLVEKQDVSYWINLVSGCLLTLLLFLTVNSKCIEQSFVYTSGAVKKPCGEIVQRKHHGKMLFRSHI